MAWEHRTPHQPSNTNRPRTIIRTLDEIPAFANECEEVEFWDTHELSDELWDALPPLPDDEIARLERIRAKRWEQRARRAAG